MQLQLEAAVTPQAFVSAFRCAPLRGLTRLISFRLGLRSPVALPQSIVAANYKYDSDATATSRLRSGEHWCADLYTFSDPEDYGPDSVSSFNLPFQSFPSHHFGVRFTNFVTEFPWTISTNKHLFLTADSTTMFHRLFSTNLRHPQGVVKTHRLLFLVPTALLAPSIPDSSNES